ncbi:MAG: hypothetical protein ACYC0Q_01700 [Eubacteriales bacterium]
MSNEEKVIQILESMQFDIKNIKVDIKNLKTEVQKIDGKVDKLELRLENEAFNKISALLDGYHQNAEKLADHTERLDRIESKITTHDIKIQILDKTKANKRKAK